MFWFNFIMDRTNTIVVSTLDDKPFFWIKSISSDDLNISKKEKKSINNVFDSASLLTPILAYEYYLNNGKNILETK